MDNPILISGGVPAYPRDRREAPIMRGVAAERSAERSAAATGGGGPAGLPRPAAPPPLLPTEARHFAQQPFSFQVYLACAETKPHQSRGWNSLPGKAQSATGNRVLRRGRQRPRRSVDRAIGRP